MSEMPDLVLLKIFGFFGISQRFRLRLVCKRWRFLVDQVKQRNLCFYGFNFPRENDLSPNRELEVQSDEMVWTEKEVNFNFETTFFRKLERLFLCHIERPVNWIFQINQLECLKELTIAGIFLESIETLKLELKNLEVLSLRESYFYSLELNTPHLSTLVLWKTRRKVKVLFPEKVTFLECEDFIIDLKPFVNLETLLVRKLKVNLADHPKLKVIDLRDQEKELWENLRAQAWGRKDLTVYSFGFRNIFCPRSTSEPVRIDESFISKNYGELERPITFGMHFDYDTLLSVFGGSIPKNLFKKLINVIVINAWSIQEQSMNHLQLLRLLKESKCERLTVHNELPQFFYDSLPDCFLDGLNIAHLGQNNNNFKLDFLAKMTRLRSLRLDLDAQQLSFSSIYKIIQNCRFLCTFNLTNRVANKLRFEMNLDFNWVTKKIETFEVNGEQLQIITREEIIRYFKERAHVLQMNRDALQR